MILKIYNNLFWSKCLNGPDLLPDLKKNIVLGWVLFCKWKSHLIISYRNHMLKLTFSSKFTVAYCFADSFLVTAAPFPGYTTIPTIPTTQNQTFVFSPLGVINSQPNLLPAHSQASVSGIGQQQKGNDMHKVSHRGSYVVRDQFWLVVGVRPRLLLQFLATYRITRASPREQVEDSCSPWTPCQHFTVGTYIRDDDWVTNMSVIKSVS